MSIDEDDLVNTFVVQQIGFNSPEFKHTLIKAGITSESVLVRSYRFPIDFVVPTIYFLGLESDFREDIRYDNFIEQVTSLKFEVLRKYFDNKVFVKVDETIYYRVLDILVKEKLNDHIEPITSILKEGYYNRFLADARNKKNEIKIFETDIIKFYNLVSSSDTIQKVILQSNKSKAIDINSKILISMLNIYFQNFFLGKKVGPNFINDYINNIQKKKTGKQITLQDYHRNITVYKLIFYLYKNTEYLKKKKKDTVNLTEKEYALIGDLLTDSKIVDDATLNVPRYGNKVEHWFNRFLEKNQQYKSYILTDEYPPSDTDNFDAYHLK